MIRSAISIFVACALSTICGAAPYVFVAESRPGDGTIQVINGSLGIYDIATGRAAADAVSVGPLPVAVAVAKTHDRAYVLSKNNYGNGTVAVVSTAAKRTIATVTVGADPIDLLLSPDDRYAYVSNARSVTVSVIELVSNRVLSEVSLGGYLPQAISPDGRTLYAGSGSYLIQIDAGTFARTLTATADFIGPVVASPDSRYVYIANTQQYAGTFMEPRGSDNTVSVLSATSSQVIQKIEVGQGPSALTLSADGRFLYVWARLAGTVSVIDTTLGKEIQRHVVPIASNSFSRQPQMKVAPDGTTLIISDTASKGYWQYTLVDGKLAMGGLVLTATLPYAVAVRNELAPTGPGPLPARLQVLGGDRQILIGEQRPASFTARVVDANGNPVSRQGVIVGPLGAGLLGPTLADEFGYRGFNVTSELVKYAAFEFPPPQFVASGDDGIVTGTTDWSNSPPSAYVVGAAAIDGTQNSTSIPQTFFSIVRLGATPPGAPVVAVEYFNQDLQHYFVTAGDEEIRALDAGKFSGWQRSIGALAVYPTRVAAPTGAAPVCRFYSATFNTHFYTVDAAECAAVQMRWPEVWQLETREAFYVMPLDPQSGRCPANFQPVYRLFIARNGPTHRYVADVQLRELMASRGWTREGNGPELAVFCVNQ